MEQNKILERLKSIVTEYEPPPEPIMLASVLPPPADACWVDGNRCPYGFPNGRFQDRPIHICHLGGCNRLNTLEEDVYNFWRSYSVNEIDDKLETKLEKEQVSLSSELRMIAEERFECGLPEIQILELAADIIDGKPYDKKIIRVDDIRTV